MAQSGASRRTRRSGPAEPSRIPHSFPTSTGFRIRPTAASAFAPDDSCPPTVCGSRITRSTPAPPRSRSQRSGLWRRSQRHGRFVLVQVMVSPGKAEAILHDRARRGSLPRAAGNAISGRAQRSSARLYRDETDVDPRSGLAGGAVGLRPAPACRSGRKWTAGCRRRPRAGARGSWSMRRPSRCTRHLVETLSAAPLVRICRIGRFPSSGAGRGPVAPCALERERGVQPSTAPRGRRRRWSSSCICSCRKTHDLP